MIDGDKLGEEIGDALEAMTDAVRAAPPLVPPEEQAAFWAEVQEIVRRSGRTYVSGQVFTSARLGGRGAEMTYRVEVRTDDPRGPFMYNAMGPRDVPRMLASLRHHMPQQAQVLNLRDFGAGGVKPRPWGPFDLPADVINVSRSGHNTYASPFPFDSDTDRGRSLAEYLAYAIERHQRDPGWIRGLDGKRLACWCRPPGSGFGGKLRCHAQILVGLRDNVPPETVE